MNNLNLTNPGQVAFYQDTLKFMQDASNAQFTGIVAAIADNAIVAGCVPDGNGNISAGWIILNGELLPFAGGTALQYFDVQQTTTSEQYNDGSMKPFYNTRTAVMTSAQSGTAVAFAQFIQLKTLKQLAGVITNYTNTYKTPQGQIISDPNTIPTMAAIAALLQSLQNTGVPIGFIGMWSGAVTAIPAGWALCNGQNGTPDLRDKFIVGAGNSYAVGATGGEAAHALAKSELPAVGVGYKDRYMAGSPGDLPGATTTEAMPAGYNNKLGSNGHDNDNTLFLYLQATTDNLGSGAAHENRPPYYALAYIMYCPPTPPEGGS